MVSIPTGIYTTYKDYADTMISEFGITCTLYFEEKIQTTSVPAQPISQRRQMIPGGTFGQNGTNYTTVETSQNLKMRAYWTKKDWVKVNGWEREDVRLQTIAYLSDLKLIKRCNRMRVNIGDGVDLYLAGEPTPHGILQDRYIVCLWRT